jgi:hypothetical protein
VKFDLVTGRYRRRGAIRDQISPCGHRQARKLRRHQQKVFVAPLVVVTCRHQINNVSTYYVIETAPNQWAIKWTRNGISRGLLVGRFDDRMAAMLNAKALARLEYEEAARLRLRPEFRPPTHARR